MGGIRLPTYFIATIIKTVWYWQRDGYIDQWNKIKNPKIDAYKYTQMPKSFTEKKESFQHMVLQ